MSDSYGHNLSDEALLVLCKQRLPGDSRPFTALSIRYQQSVLATCYRLLGNRQDAEDAAQEVFIRLYRNINNFAGKAKFSTWLYQITLNVCRTQLRARSRRPQLEESPLVELENRLPAHTSSEEAVLKRAEADIVWLALQALNEDERIALILRETNGLPYAEIAETLKISLSAAKMRVLRARLALQQHYKAFLGEEK